MRGRVLAGALGLAAVLAAAGAVACVRAVGWTFTEALEAFVVSNILIGVSFALCGALIAWHRPSSALGWMYAVGGLCQTASALAAPLAELLDDRGAAEWVVRLDRDGVPVGVADQHHLDPDLAAAAARWPARVSALATRRDRRRGHRAAVRARGRARRRSTRPACPTAYLTLERGHVRLPGLAVDRERGRAGCSRCWSAWCASWSATARGTEVVRRQLLWLVAAAAVIVVAVTPWALVAGTPLAVLFTIPLLPAAVAAAVLRHQLLDIRLVVARGLTYALLSGLVLAAYAGLVVVLSGVASALLVALLALPLRSRLQTAVDQLLYGERGDPLKVASRVGRSLGAGLPETLDEIRMALRLPYVGVVVDGEAARDRWRARRAVGRPAPRGRHAGRRPAQGRDAARPGRRARARAALRTAVHRGARHHPARAAAALPRAARGRP